MQTVTVGAEGTMQLNFALAPAGTEIETILVVGGRGRMGRWFARFDGPSDGTVAVAETRLAGLADHCCVDASHSGLLLSPAAAAQVVCFLREGRFQSIAGSGDGTAA